jgi:hypothetical protein
VLAFCIHNSPWSVLGVSNFFFGGRWQKKFVKIVIIVHDVSVCFAHILTIYFHYYYIRLQGDDDENFTQRGTAKEKKMFINDATLII